MGRGPVVRSRKDESEQAKEEGEIWKGVEQDHDFFYALTRHQWKSEKR